MKQLILLLLIAYTLEGCAQPIEPESNMVLIPAGSFTLGLDPSQEIPSFISDRTSSKNAQPQQEITLNAFYMDLHEVSYGEFLRFKPQARYAEGRLTHPMQGVSWFEADAYCLWLGKRLPTEFEWEKAARGREGNLYVWGNEFRRENGNFGKTVQPPAKQTQDLSEFGVYELNGNVSEWTASWYLPYSGSSFKDPNFGNKYKVIRGGAINKREHGFLKEFALLPYRNFAPPQMRSWDTGFRCARSAPSSSKANS
ncbi:MAG: formylglycine-generating enzyme family protein [Nitrospinota bacterium]|nr:formylglycine-generating enzyme family protein [Nitrospinota bacterium]